MRRFLSGLPILGKIAIPASLSLLISIGIIAYAVSSLSKEHRAATVLYLHTAPAALDITEARSQLRVASVASAKYLLETRPQAQADLRAGYTKAVQTLHEKVDAWARLDHVPATDGRLARIVALLPEYERLTNSQFDMFSSGEAIQRPEAFQGVRDGIGKARVDIENTISDLVAESDAALQKSAEQSEARYNVTFRSLLVGSIVSVMLAASVFVWIARSEISLPLLSMTRLMKRLASGELDIEVEGTQRRDEIGGMATAVQVFKDAMIRGRDLQDASDREHAAMRRRQAAMDIHTRDFGTSVAGVMKGLMQSAESMRGAAEGMAQAVAVTRQVAGETTRGANASAGNLGSVAAAVEQLSSSINEISQQVVHTTTAAQQAVERAGATDVKVGSLAEAAGRIGDVVSLISSITGQTNLLALNATIEAARAGDAGKGFAVVASEVKALATQTAKATEEISGQIAAIRDATSEAVNSVREVGTAIRQVDVVATAIAAAVEEQAAATREIAASVQNVTTMVQQSSRSMQEVLHATDRADNASQAVQQAADQVGSTSGTLESEVAHFLHAMSSGSEEERRRYERISGHGAMASLRAAGQGEMRVAIKDISRGGVALVCNWQPPAGTEVEVLLPGIDALVTGRAVRSEQGVLVVTFRQDAPSLARLDRVLAQFSTVRQAA